MNHGSGVPCAQELPAVPDEPDLALPRSLQLSGHTPREQREQKPKQLRVSPKRKAAAKAEAAEAERK